MNETDRRVKRTRKLLQEAFMALMAEKSFQSISVQDIAERADVNRATFYTHFVDKYALLDYTVSDWFRQTLTSRVSVTSPFNQANLHLLVVAVLEHFAAFHSHCMPSDRDLGPLIEARVQQDLEAFLREWLDRAGMDRRVSRETIAQVLSWAIFGVGIAWSRGPRDVSADDTAREILTFLNGGMRVDEFDEWHAPTPTLPARGEGEGLARSVHSPQTGLPPWTGGLRGALASRQLDNSSLFGGEVGGVADGDDVAGEHRPGEGLAVVGDGFAEVL